MKAGTDRAPESGERYVGVFHAVVTQNKDPENKNQIKVRLPFLDNGDTDQSGKVQLTAPMIGDKFGWYTLPDVGDNVIVAFVGGDINHPIVLGGVWSTVDPAPEQNVDGKNNFRGYRSRTGHRLIFDDSAKHKVTFVDTSQDLMLGLGQFAADGDGINKHEVHRPAAGGDMGLALSSMKGKVSISCPSGALSVKAGQNLVIEISEAMDVACGASLEISSKVTKLTSSQPGSYAGNPTTIGP